MIDGMTELHSYVLCFYSKYPNRGAFECAGCWLRDHPEDAEKVATPTSWAINMASRTSHLLEKQGYLIGTKQRNRRVWRVNDE